MKHDGFEESDRDHSQHFVSMCLGQEVLKALYKHSATFTSSLLFTYLFNTGLADVALPGGYDCQMPHGIPLHSFNYVPVRLETLGPVHPWKTQRTPGLQGLPLTGVLQGARGYQVAVCLCAILSHHVPLIISLS